MPGVHLEPAEQNPHFSTSGLRALCSAAPFSNRLQWFEHLFQYRTETQALGNKLLIMSGSQDKHLFSFPLRI